MANQIQDLNEVVVGFNVRGVLQSIVEVEVSKAVI
jgi:hypothetical protein